MDVVETYFGLSVRLLEICNYLRDGVAELEYSQLSLEHCLGTLAGLVGSLEGPGEFMAAEKQLESCRLELEKMASKTAPNLWLEVKAKSRGSSSSDDKKQVQPELTLLGRCVSVIPAPSDNSKAFLIAQVMRDVREVMTFVSHLLLWIMTDTSEQFSFFLHAFRGPGLSPGAADAWSAALANLSDRIENSDLKQKRSNCALSVNEIRAVYDAVRDLMDQIRLYCDASAPKVRGLGFAIAVLSNESHLASRISEACTLIHMQLFKVILWFFTGEAISCEDGEQLSTSR
ncbi:hypothetical protein R1flu_020158 [Riccia fluitans]|uniref:Uncharacterized protein n=1 Tax=Riccia fluitans TaxID=41844 RepID=A0ABD1ZL41_9MARC